MVVTVVWSASVVIAADSVSPAVVSVGAIQEKSADVKTQQIKRANAKRKCLVFISVVSPAFAVQKRLSFKFNEA